MVKFLSCYKNCISYVVEKYGDYNCMRPDMIDACRPSHIIYSRIDH